MSQCLYVDSHIYRVPTLPVISLYSKKPTPLLLPLPPLKPHLHPFPALTAAHVNRWNDLCDPQGTAKHGQFPKRTVLAIRHAKARALLRAAAMRYHVAGREASLPIVRVQHRRYRWIVECSPGRGSVVPSCWADTYYPGKVRSHRVQIVR